MQVCDGPTDLLNGTAGTAACCESRKLASDCMILLRNERNHGDHHCRSIGNDTGDDADAMGTSAEAAVRPDSSQRLAVASGLFLRRVRMIDSDRRESMAIYFSLYTSQLHPCGLHYTGRTAWTPRS